MDDNIDNNFLSKVNLDALQQDLNMDMTAISNKIGVSTQTMYKWNRDKKKGGCRPTYDSIRTLIECGASIETLFGIEYKAGIKIVEKPIKLTALDISEVLAMASEALKKNPQ